jgi:hypothetical protein
MFVGRLISRFRSREGQRSRGGCGENFRSLWTPKVSVVGPEGEINGNREVTAMPGYNELGDPRAVGTEREETRWNP